MAESQREQYITLRTQGLSKEEALKAVRGKDQSGIRDFGVGLVKSGLNTARGTAGVLQGIGQGFLAGIDPTRDLEEIQEQTGFKSVSNQTKEGKGVREILQPKGGAEKAGSFVGDVAQFAVPANKLSKAGSLLKRSARFGAADAGVQIAQDGNIDQDAVNAFVFGGITPVAGNMFSAARKGLTQSLPKRLVEPLLKQAKDAKIKGKNIAPFLVEKGRIGTVDDLIQQGAKEIEKLNESIANLLRKGTNKGVRININEVKNELVEKINLNGGSIDELEVSKIIERLAPQAKGLLKKSDLNLEDANRLRVAIDNTIGDRGFLREQLPFNKDVLRDFTNTLRERVKTVAPKGTRESFDELSKEITLERALLERANSGGGGKSFGLLDGMATGLGVTIGGIVGGPVGSGIGATIGFTGRKSFESAIGKTSLARLVKSPEKVLKRLESLSPSVQATFLEVLDQITSDVEQPNN